MLENLFDSLEKKTFSEKSFIYLQTQYDYLKVSYTYLFPELLQSIKLHFDGKYMTFDNVDNYFKVFIEFFINNIQIYCNTFNPRRIKIDTIMNSIKENGVLEIKVDQILIKYMKDLYNVFKNSFYKKYSIDNLIPHLINNDLTINKYLKGCDTEIKEFYNTFLSLINKTSKSDRLDKIKLFEKFIPRDLIFCIQKYDDFFNKEIFKRYYIPNNCYINMLGHDRILQKLDYKYYIHNFITGESNELKIDITNIKVNFIDNLMIISSANSLLVYDYITTEKLYTKTNLPDIMSNIKILDINNIIFNDNIDLYCMNLQTDNIVKILPKVTNFEILSDNQIIFQQNSKTLGIYNINTKIITLMKIDSDCPIIKFIVISENQIAIIRKVKNIEIWNITTKLKEIQINSNGNVIYDSFLVLENKIAIIVKHKDKKILKIFDPQNGSLYFEFEGFENIYYAGSCNNKLVISSSRTLYVLN